MQQPAEGICEPVLSEDSLFAALLLLSAAFFGSRRAGHQGYGAQWADAHYGAFVYYRTTNIVNELQ